MSRRAPIAWFVGLSFAAASLATVGVVQLVRAYQEEFARLTVEAPRLSVVVAKRPLSPGRALVADDLEIARIDADLVPESVFHDLSEVIGRVPVDRVLTGELVRVERLAPPEAGTGLAALLPKGYRAASVDIANGHALSGFLDPGNYVDVLVTLDDPGKGGAATLTVLQGVPVIAVDARLGDAEAAREGAYAPSITLALLPEDAQKLTHADEQGSLTLTLRNDVDVTQRDSNGARVGSLIGGDEVIAFTPPAPARRVVAPVDEGQTIDLYRGTAHTEVKVP